MTETPGVGQVPGLDDEAVRWSVPPEQRAGRPLLVLLHGYGADEHDLFGLVPYLPSEFVVASVRAPLTPPFPMPGASWYPIEGLQARASTAITASAERFLEWLDRASDAETVALLGFSQGAAISLQALRLRPQRFACVVDLAGYVDADPLPGDALLAELRPPVFWGRGGRDEVIPADRVEYSVAWLPAHVELSGRVYPYLTHGISEEELGDVRAFLSKHVPSPQS